MSGSQTYLGNFFRALGRLALCVVDVVFAMSIGRADRFWAACVTILLISCGFAAYLLQTGEPLAEIDPWIWVQDIAILAMIVFASFIVRRRALKRGNRVGE